MKNVLKLTAVALMVSLAAGCSSSGSSGGGDTAPQFDGDLGFENVDPGYGVDAPDGDQTPDLGFDFGYVYIPDLGEEVPVPTHPIMGTPSNPIEIDINNPDSKMAAVKERSDENETLYSVYIGEVRVGEIIINDDGISIEALHSDKTITAVKNTEEDSWQVRGADGNVKGDVKRLEDGTWLIREEITREVYVSVIKDGERIFVPVSEVKGALKSKLKTNNPARANLHKIQTLKARPKLG